MSLLLRVTLFLSILLLAGCFGRNTIEYVVVKDYVLVDDFDLRDCPILPPPNREEYIAASKEQRIKMWTEQYYDATQSAKLRNVQLKHMREQMELYRNEVTE